MPALVNALNKVDFPTLGNPTIPHFKLMAIPEIQAGKCMRWPSVKVWPGRLGMVAHLLASLLLGLAAMAHAGPPALSPLLLEDTTAAIDAQNLGDAWVDEKGNAGLEQVLQAEPALFQPPPPDVIYTLGEEGALWLRFRLLRGNDQRQGWLMVFPMPLLDRVTVYQQDSHGHWQGQTAGDTLAVSTWSEPGRYAHFRLDLPRSQARDVYARIQHVTAADFPIQLLSERAYDQRVQIEYLGLGLTFGALLLLITACLALSLVYRDGVYAWYALYALLTALALSAYTGVAAHLLWPDFRVLGDAHQGFLALLAAAAALLFVRNLTGISARHQLIDKLAYWVGLGGIALAALFPLLPKPAGLTVLTAYIGGTTVANMLIALAAWRRGDGVGAWVLLAYAPLSLALGMALMRLFGWLPESFGTQYAIVVAMAVEVPLLMVALNIRSRERHGAHVRELALSSQDALTGLLAPHLFHDRLRQVVARYRRDKQNAAVVFIDLVNHPWIKERYGSAVAEQSLLRCVIKLRRLLRDVDTVSRIGEARFGLILEGDVSRQTVTERAARLIAAGLMPLPGLKPDVTLQFHTAALLLDERIGEPADLVAALAEVLAKMSPRTRRPIRFLNPEKTSPAPLALESWPDSQPAAPSEGLAAPLSRDATWP
jgi:GGDEF domain-containing protein